jgi:hypothetical protein
LPIGTPKLPVGHPDRGIGCQTAIADDFKALAKRAEAERWKRKQLVDLLMILAAKAERAGWMHAEVEEALIKLTDAHNVHREVSGLPKDIFGRHRQLARPRS